MTFAVEASEVASAAYMVVACMAAAYTSDPVVERNSDLEHILVEAPVDTCPVEAPVDTCPVEASAAYMVVACMAAAFVVAAYTSDPVVERNLALDQD